MARIHDTLDNLRHRLTCEICGSVYTRSINGGGRYQADIHCDPCMNRLRHIKHDVQFAAAIHHEKAIARHRIIARLPVETREELGYTA